VGSSGEKNDSGRPPALSNRERRRRLSGQRARDLEVDLDAIAPSLFREIERAVGGGNQRLRQNLDNFIRMSMPFVPGADGMPFLMIRRDDALVELQINVVLNWTEELNRLVAGSTIRGTP